MRSRHSFLHALGATLIGTSGCGDAPVAIPDGGSDAGPCSPAPDELATPPIHTPRWAFEPWISKDISDAADTRAFVLGFETRGIPVGVVVLDSPWETNYTTFVPNPARYPGFDALVDELHAGGIRIVLWTTQMINTSSFDFEAGGDVYDGASPNFEEGSQCRFFVNDGETYGWWKGVGAGLDFFHPGAAAWWHRQQDPLFDMGVDGFKLDFGENYVRTDPVRTRAGEVSHQQYSERYYEDFLAYGVARRGPEDFVTMVRPWDESYDFEGRFFARREHAPVAWVGDNRRDWIGLADALDHVFRSAQAGYVALGSDIGGYLDRDDVKLNELVAFDADVFARWTAFGALSPFMQLHGRANLTPWTLPEDPYDGVAQYRYWATLHHELVPFLYSLAERAYVDGGPIMHPVGEPGTWAGDYRYVLGEALLVAPILDATGRRDVALPSGARWYDWWAPEHDGYDGGSMLEDYDATDRLRIPLFVRAGAIVPLAVDSDATGLGTAASAGHLTVLVYPASTVSSFELVDDDGGTTSLSAHDDGTARTVTMSRAAAPTLLRIRTDAAPLGATLDGAPIDQTPTLDDLAASPTGWFPDPSGRFAWVKVGSGPRERTVTVTE